jgi:hypothetical protein
MRPPLQALYITHVFRLLVGFQAYLSGSIKILDKLDFPNTPPPSHITRVQNKAILMAMDISNGLNTLFL